MKPRVVNYQAIIIVIAIIYLFAVAVILSAGSAALENPNTTVTNELSHAIDRLTSQGLKAIFPYNPECSSLIGGVTFFTIIMGIYYIVLERGKVNDAFGKEHGSAKWNTSLEAYNRTYTAPYGKEKNSFAGNIILSAKVFLGLDGRKTRRNLNTLVVGGSGAGKSRFLVKPNLLQASDIDGEGTSYVITDPSGELLESCGTFLKEKGYKIRVLNLTDMKHSSCYNPFDYLREDEDVLILINCLIKNTTPQGTKSGEDFWVKSETALLQALFFYLWKHCNKEEQNFVSVMKLLRAAEIDENDSSAESPLDQIFNEIGEANPNDMGYKSYRTFKMGAGKTLKGILISAAVRLNSFEIPAVAAMVNHDYENAERNLNFNDFKENKVALFCIIPSADDTYNFIVAMMYYQLFATLYYFYDHDKVHIKYPVRFMLDEFANIGTIPDFDKKLATMRKYSLSCTIILQNIKQLEEMYDKKTEPLIGNCDTFLFLGSSEPGTTEYISKRLGKTTVGSENFSRSKGTTGSSSRSKSMVQRDLMTPDEVGLMHTDDCIVFVRGVDPFYDKKYEYEKHPNYKLTGDYDDSLKYDIAKEFEEEMGMSKNDKASADEFDDNEEVKTPEEERPVETYEATQTESGEEPTEKSNKKNKKIVPLFTKEFWEKGKEIFIKTFSSPKNEPVADEDSMDNILNEADMNEDYAGAYVEDDYAGSYDEENSVVVEEDFSKEFSKQKLDEDILNDISVNEDILKTLQDESKKEPVKDESVKEEPVKTVQAENPIIFKKNETAPQKKSLDDKLDTNNIKKSKKVKQEEKEFAEFEKLTKSISSLDDRMNSYEEEDFSFSKKKKVEKTDTSEEKINTIDELKEEITKEVEDIKDNSRPIDNINESLSDDITEAIESESDNESSISKNNSSILEFDCSAALIEESVTVPKTLANRRKLLNNAPSEKVETNAPNQMMNMVEEFFEKEASESASKEVNNNNIEENVDPLSFFNDNLDMNEIRSSASFSDEDDDSEWNIQTSDEG